MIHLRLPDVVQKTYYEMFVCEQRGGLRWKYERFPTARRKPQTAGVAPAARSKEPRGGRGRAYRVIQNGLAQDLVNGPGMGVRPKTIVGVRYMFRRTTVRVTPEGANPMTGAAPPFVAVNHGPICGRDRVWRVGNEPPWRPDVSSSLLIQWLLCDQTPETTFLQNAMKITTPAPHTWE